MRVRSKLLVAMLLISAGLTSTSLLVVRRLVETRLRNQVLQDTRNSVATFRNAQAQREAALQNAAALMANLPILRAMMTSADPMTIQDASADLFRLATGPAGGPSSADLFVLADRTGVVMGLHTTGYDFSIPRAHELIMPMLEHNRRSAWWFGGNRLFQVAMQPIFFGAADDQHLLGYLFLGDEVDDATVRELKQVAASEVGFFAGPDGQQMVRATLPASSNEALERLAPRIFDASGEEFHVGQEPYLITCVELAEAGAAPVHLVVMKSLKEAQIFVSNLDRVLVALGMLAILAGAALVSVMSRTFTRPLDRLVAGVRALGRGDYEYPLSLQGRDEVAEVTNAFDRMRTSLRQSQRELLEAERLVTIGRMASSISHDLRHHLVAIVANAEYLSDSRREAERQELCDELRMSAHQMTDMIDSLLELSRPRESLRLAEVLIQEVIGRAVHTVQAHPEFMHVQVDVTGDDPTCYVDPGKLQRTIQNLVINACEAIAGQPDGRVKVDVRAAGEALELRVSDNGRGINETVRNSAFEPFVSHGKENGTGLGLTVVQKIVADHGGQVSIETTSQYGTTILICLPLAVSAAASGPAPAAMPAR